MTATRLASLILSEGRDTRLECDINTRVATRWASPVGRAADTCSPATTPALPRRLPRIRRGRSTKFAALGRHRCRRKPGGGVGHPHGSRLVARGGAKNRPSSIDRPVPRTCIGVASRLSAVTARPVATGTEDTVASPTTQPPAKSPAAYVRPSGHSVLPRHGRHDAVHRTRRCRSALPAEGLTDARCARPAFVEQWCQVGSRCRSAYSTISS
jgi:hypothetical protein